MKTRKTLSKVTFVALCATLLSTPVLSHSAHAEDSERPALETVKADLDSPTARLPVTQKDKIIWETHEIARITALQCHDVVPYNNFVVKWRKEIVESENRIMHDLTQRHVSNIEGFLTDEDNKIAKNLNEYYGRNVCMMPASITEETAAVPYDIEDISNFDFNYGHLDVLKS